MLNIVLNGGGRPIQYIQVQYILYCGVKQQQQIATIEKKITYNIYNNDINICLGK